MCVASKPSLMPALAMSMAAVCAPSPPDPASLSEMSCAAMCSGYAVQKRGTDVVEPPMTASTRSGSKAGGAGENQGSRTSSFFTPSG